MYYKCSRNLPQRLLFGNSGTQEMDQWNPLYIYTKEIMLQLNYVLKNFIANTETLSKAEKCYF